MSDIIIGSGKVIRVEFESAKKEEPEYEYDEWGDPVVKRGRLTKLKDISTLGKSKIVSYISLGNSMSGYDKIKREIKFSSQLEFGKEYEIILREKATVKTEGRKFREDE